MAEAYNNKIWCRDFGGKWAWVRAEFVLPGFFVKGRDGRPLLVEKVSEVLRKHVCFRVFYDGDDVGIYTSAHKWPVRNMEGNEFMVRTGTIIKRRAPFFRSVSSEAMGNGEGVIRVDEVKSEPCLGFCLESAGSAYVTGPGVITFGE